LGFLTTKLFTPPYQKFPVKRRAMERTYPNAHKIPHREIFLEFIFLIKNKELGYLKYYSCLISLIIHK